MKQQKLQRQQFQFIYPIQTRWSDNDVYGHVNNIIYYSFFDSAANALLIQHAGFDIQQSPMIGLVVESKCQYFAELCYPEQIEVGVAIHKIGHSSLTYALAIFKQGQYEAAAQGHFVHVFVERSSRKSTAIPEAMRISLSAFMLPSIE